MIAFIAINLSFLTVISAQNQILADSLKITLMEVHEDSERMSILYKISLSVSSPDEIIQYSNQLISLAEKYDDASFIQAGLMSLGTAYRLGGDLEKALDNLFESAKIAEEHDLVVRLGQAYGEIATVYAGNRDFRNALNYNRKASEIFISLSDSLTFSLASINIGFQYYRLGLLDSALYQYGIAEAYFLKKDKPIETAYVIGNRAIVKLAMGDVNQAELDFRQAIKILEPVGDQYGIADFLNELGKVYVERGDQLKAIEVIKKGLIIAKEIDIKAQIRDASELLSDLHRKRGEFEEALAYHQQFVAYKDSIQNTETVRKLANQRTEFEIGQAQAQMDAEQQTQKVINVALIFGLGLLTVFGFAQYRNSRQRKRINDVLRDQKSELETQKAELQEVNRTKDRFFSIISHDLRGPVNAFHGVSRMIKFFVQNKQIDQLEVLTEDIDQSVDRLSSLLDNLLNWAVQQQGQFPYVPEKIELKTLADDLVDVFATMAKSKQIVLQSTVPEDLHAWADRNTTMTIIRNLMSNALKFTHQHGQVSLNARSTGTVIEIEVHDNGVGIPQEKLGQLFQLNEKASTWGTEGEKGLGLGLQLVHEFVELNQGQITVTSEEKQGTTFKVTLPMYELSQIQAET